MGSGKLLSMQAVTFMTHLVVTLLTRILQATGDYYNSRNIRYAQPLVGDLRFAAPQPPLVDRTLVPDGQDGRICPQGFDNWQKTRALFILGYFTNPNNISASTNTPAPGSDVTISQAPKDGRTNEDCLFLNVLVPRSIYETGFTADGPCSSGHMEGASTLEVLDHKGILPVWLQDQCQIHMLPRASSLSLSTIASVHLVSSQDPPSTPMAGHKMLVFTTSGWP